jgi:RNA polymerase sigma-70 factor (ECF subfamily)
VVDRVADDLSLLDRIAGRDASAVGELYDRHGRVLYALAYRILRDSGDAEDVIQEVFLRVWEKGYTYTPALGSPMAWLVRIARNRAIDRLRARQARPALQPAEDLLDLVIEAAGGLNPEESAQVAQAQRAVAAALGRLSVEQRTLIEEAFFLGFTQSELAEKFGLPLGTVKTRIRSGLLAMREHLQQAV